MDGDGRAGMHEGARRALWFVLFWVAGVAALGLVALAIRAMIP